MHESVPDQQNTPEKPPPKNEFLDKAVTRRDFLKFGAAAGGAYALKDWSDYQDEKLDEFGITQRIKDALGQMESLDIKLPKDKLYGFRFPSTKEMAEKFKQALEKQVGSNSPIPSLTIIQERNSKTVVGKILQSDKDDGDPRVIKSDNPDSPSYLHLPPYIEHRSLPQLIATLYHEGIHLFYQTNTDGSAESRFKNENFATIADLLLEKIITKNTPTRPNTMYAYDTAVAKNDPASWETHLKQIYNLSTR